MANPPSDSRPVSPSPSQLPPVPQSPVYSIASTANPISAFNLPAPPVPRPSHPVLSKADLANSQDAYADLLSSAKAYRLALAQLSTAASSFGAALESCARLKEATAEPLDPMGGGTNMLASFTTKGSCTADTLMSASGFHHLIANHQQILSETVYRSFEVPLLHDLDKWQTVIDDEEATYQQKIKAQAKEVKRLEKEGLKLHKQKRRDVARFRAHLVQLTEKLDGMTVLQADHARTNLRESQDTSNRIVDASCSLVRAEVDIFEAVARKGWTGGGLDDLLEKGTDLFAPIEDMGNPAVGMGQGNAETAKLFSILPPRSILADSASEISAARGGNGPRGRNDSLLVDTERYQSLAAVTARDADKDSVFSADFNKPRGVRPFSPQPIRRTPMAFDSFTALESPLGSPTKEEQKQLEQKRDEMRRNEEVNIEDVREGNDHEDEDVDDEGARWRDSQGHEDRRMTTQGTESPELITDESSPEARWDHDDDDR